MNLKKLHKIFLVGSSFAFVACSTTPPPPKGEACVAFVRQDGTCTNLCYDMEKDFDKDGEIKPGTKAKRYACDTPYFHKRINFDPDSYANLKAYALKLKAKCEEK